MVPKNLTTLANHDPVTTLIDAKMETISGRSAGPHTAK